MLNIQKKIYTRNKTCLVCKSEKLIKFISLGKTALANSYLTKKQLNAPEKKVPLEVYYCNKCHLVQLLDIVDRKVLFEKYAYYSSTSPQLVEHFRGYAETIVKRFPKQSKKLTLEIASNDGILLKPLKALGVKVLGVDPARNIARKANREGIETIPKFFNSSLVSSILKKYGNPGVIVANNVLAHTDKLTDIIASVKQLLDIDGVFISQSKYLGDLIDKNEFDTIYHEHVSYFSFLSTKFLFNQFGLDIFDVEHVETEGGSLRIFATHINSRVKPDKKVINLIKNEQGVLDNRKTYLKFSSSPKIIKEKLNKILKRIKSKKLKIAGYGASAKGNTLLQYCRIEKKYLDFLVDNAPSKQGLYTPGTHIPIYPPSHLKKETPDYVLILAWNFAESIIKKESWFTSLGGKFILPIPTPKILP